MSDVCGCDDCVCDPIPNESTVIAEVISDKARRTGETSDLPPLTEMQRQDLLDEIEFDLL